MTPKALTLKNVSTHEDVSLDLSFGVTGVIGKNGCGKSAIIDGGLYFAITGKPTPGNTKMSMLKWQESVGHTDFRFEHDGSDYRIMRNIHNSAVLLTCDDDDEFKLTNKDANEWMEDALGMNFQLFYESCWVPQDGFTRIINMTHGERMTFFQKLANTRKAEVIRGVLQDSINNLPAHPDRTEELSALTTECEALRDSAIPATERAIADYTKTKEEFEKKLPTVSVTLQTRSEDEYNTSVQQASAAYTTAADAVRTYKETHDLEQVMPEVECLSVAEEQSRTMYENYQATLKRIQDAEQAINTLVQPEPIKEDKELAEEVKALTAKVEPLRSVYKMAKDKVCPTCQQEFAFTGGEQERVRTIKDFEESEEKLRHSKAALERHQAEVLSVTNAIDLCKSRMNAFKEDIAKFQEELVHYENHNHDPVAYAQRKNEYVQYTNWLKRTRDAQDHLSKLETASVRAQVYLDEVKKQPFVTAQQKQDAEEFQTAYSELQAILQAAHSNKAAASARLTSLEAQLQTYTDEQAIRGRVHEARKFLTRAREVLHRDQLPKLVMRKMLYGLNILLDSYLALFSVDFTAHIDDEFNFMVTFVGMPSTAAGSLSGGQKVALGIAFRFALSDMNSSNIPLLVMDEPTNHLDANNIQNMGEILQKAREMTEDGVIVLVATHKEELMSSFTEVVNVEDL
jgi:exonuclease SbcC